MAAGLLTGHPSDSEGCIFRRRWSTAELLFATHQPEKLTELLEMPVLKATSLTFGGPGLDVMYVTSMSKPPLPRFPEDGQLRGSLFAVTGLGVTGVAEPRYGK